MEEQRNNARNGEKTKRGMKNGKSNGEKHSLERKEKSGLTNGSSIGTKVISKGQTGVISMTRTWKQSITGVRNGITKGN